MKLKKNKITFNLEGLIVETIMDYSRLVTPEQKVRFSAVDATGRIHNFRDFQIPSYLNYKVGLADKIKISVTITDP